ncbi:MAG: bile acid:sodium symporter [Deltaproteobacteria bacterium]|nr:bile acid:sodium symporter [Deltaproteobacteria bacterium]MBW2661725.1 bile acid:sodium symporter [Deltaproteobacteria bacterium]
MLKKILLKYWFFIGIVIVALAAFNFPGIGAKIKEWNLLKIGIFIAFLITGLQLDTKAIVDEIKNIKTLSASLISSLILFPLITFFLAGLLFKSSNDFIVGACIIAVAPVTVASGTVLTGIARGNIPLSLFICISSNFAAIFTIPFSLNLLLQFNQDMNLPVLAMIKSLIIIVLIPIILGQLLRTSIKNYIMPYKKLFSIFSQLIVLLIIFNAISSSTSKIATAGHKIIFIFLFMILLHTIILLLNFGISKIIRLNRASTSAFTIHTSQKTLTVSYIVWAGYFASDFPMAMIPPISYHLTQMIMDTFLAHRFMDLAKQELT